MQLSLVVFRIDIESRNSPFLAIDQATVLLVAFDGVNKIVILATPSALYGKGTAIWGSEIEPFCVAVTKKHFPED